MYKDFIYSLTFLTQLFPIFTSSCEVLGHNYHINKISWCYQLYTEVYKNISSQSSDLYIRPIVMDYAIFSPIIVFKIGYLVEKSELA